MEIVALILVLGFFLLGGVGFYMWRQGGNVTMKSRVERLSQLPEDLRAELQHVQDIDNEDKSKLSPILQRMTGENFTNAWEVRLAQADIPLKASEYFILIAAIFLFTAALVMSLTKDPLIGFLGALPILFLHFFVLNFLKKRRVEKFGNQLSEFLVLVVNSLRAGQTFMQGCQVAVKESPDPIAAEFKQVLKEVNLGLADEDSFENMLNRVPSEDLKIVLSAYSIQRKVGGNLAEILDTTSATIRERIKIQGQIKTLTTQGKLSGVIVGLLPFVLVAILTSVRPDIMSNLWTTFPGKCMVGIALVLQTIGGLFIKKIVTIEV
jgi:tight adherence protein B